MRYLPHSQADRDVMLTRIGVGSVDALFADVPAGRLQQQAPDLPRRKSELEVERVLGRLSARSLSAGSVPFFVGAGAYRHHVPATVDHLIQRSEFLTSYTPYQPEIAQGTLQYLFEFQTQVAALTGMEVANASMYDGSTGCAEAVLMAHRITKRRQAVLSGGLHPHYAEVARTVGGLSGNGTVSMAADVGANEDIISQIGPETSCVVVQSPDFFGNVRDLRPIAEAAQKAGALLVAVVSEAVSFGLLQSPGSQGADIVVAEGQSIGNALNFGGPYVGLFATRARYMRQMPGRLCGETVDADGRRGFVLTMSAREQHIRRDKATSNICTNSGLCCLAFTIHMTLLGGHGLRQLALINHAHAVALADMLDALPGVSVLNRSFFNEFTVKLDGRSAAAVVEQLADRGVSGGILAGVPVSRLLPGAGLDDLLIVASTELNTDEDRAAFIDALKEALSC